MACCAFALFIIGQFLAAFDGLRRLVPFGLLGEPSLASAPNPAAAWQLGMAPIAAAPARFRFGRVGRGLAVAAVLELALLGGALYFGFHAHAPDTTWCWRVIP
jgi:hypothetical protein